MLEPEPTGEPAVETTVSMPVANLDAPPPLMQEDIGAGPGEGRTDTGEPQIPAESQPEDQSSKAEAQDDEAAKKFVSPIRFLNR